MSATPETKPRLTVSQMQQLFDVTRMTLFNWRKGSATRTPLPVAKPRKGDGRMITFDPERTMKWAASNNIMIATPLAKVMGLKQSKKRRGPKPRLDS